MLNAARAALSERGEYAKTHGGTWTLFSKVFVATGEFDQELSALARQAKEVRERGDYEAAPPRGPSVSLAVGRLSIESSFGLAIRSLRRVRICIRSGWPGARPSRRPRGEGQRLSAHERGSQQQQPWPALRLDHGAR